VFSMASRRNSFGFAQPTALPRKSRISCGRLSRLFSTSSKRTRNHASSLGFAAKPHEADARTFPFARPFRFVLARGVPHPRSFRDAGFALSLAEMPCGVGHREQRRGRGSSGQVKERLHPPEHPVNWEDSIALLWTVTGFQTPGKMNSSPKNGSKRGWVRATRTGPLPPSSRGYPTWERVFLCFQPQNATLPAGFILKNGSCPV